MSSPATIEVTLGGVAQRAQEVDGVVVPASLISQTVPWMPLLAALHKIVGGRVLVSSVITSYDGSPRQGTSHPNGWAIDVTFPDMLTPGVNPHLDEELQLMTYLAKRLQGPVMFAFESDHIHIEVADEMRGVYRYPTLRPYNYKNDVGQHLRSQKDDQLWKVTPSSISLMTDQSPLTKQRKITETTLSPDRLRIAIQAVRL